MLSLPALVHVFIYTEPTDMRRGFDGLAAIVQQALGRDPQTGHLFVFFNRRRDRTKTLFWDRDGYAMYYKRLEKGAFEAVRFQPFATEAVHSPSVQVTHPELAMLLDGVDLSSVRRRKRYAKPA